MKPDWQRQQDQMRKQQEQMRKQQEDLRRQQQMAYAWQQEQQKKKKRRQQIAQVSQRSGGLSVGRDVGSVGGDMVGGDKNVTHLNTYLTEPVVDQKSGCAVFVERVVAFVMTLFVGGIVLGVFGAIIALVVGGESAVPIGLGVAGLLALGMAYVNAHNVSRNKW